MIEFVCWILPAFAMADWRALCPGLPKQHRTQKKYIQSAPGKKECSWMTLFWYKCILIWLFTDECREVGFFRFLVRLGSPLIPAWQRRQNSQRTLGIDQLQNIDARLCKRNMPSFQHHKSSFIAKCLGSDLEIFGNNSVSISALKPPLGWSLPLQFSLMQLTLLTFKLL